MECGRREEEVKKLTHYHMERGSRRIIEGIIVSCVIDLPLSKHYGEPLISRAEHIQGFFLKPILDNVCKSQALNKVPRMSKINMSQITASVKLTIPGLWIITIIQNNNRYLFNIYCVLRAIHCL